MRFQISASSVGVLVLTVFFSSWSLAAAETTIDCGVFARNLRIGETGDDVKALQVLLNTGTSTRVAEDGPGSPGNETTYFGVRTKLAVIAFQELYTEEVLLPVGLSRGSGFVGTKTRAKIGTFCETAKTLGFVPLGLTTAKTTMSANGTTNDHRSIASTASEITSTTTHGALAPALASTTASTQKHSALNLTIASTTTTKTTATSTPSLLPGERNATSAPTALSPALVAYKSDVPVVMYPSTYSASYGATIVISGAGFTSTGNVVHLDSFVVSSATTSPLGVLSFIVPKDAPVGRHELWVTNAKGESNKTFFVVLAPNAPAPVITSFTPTEGFQGTVVTVTGTGFTPTGNQVRVSSGIISDIPSADGKTLQFTVSLPIPELTVGLDVADSDIREPFGFAVVNNNGVSAQKIFYFKI